MNLTPKIPRDKSFYTLGLSKNDMLKKLEETEKLKKSLSRRAPFKLNFSSSKKFVVRKTYPVLQSFLMERYLTREHPEFLRNWKAACTKNSVVESSKEDPKKSQNLEESGNSISEQWEVSQTSNTLSDSGSACTTSSNDENIPSVIMGIQGKDVGAIPSENPAFQATKSPPVYVLGSSEKRKGRRSEQGKSANQPTSSLIVESEVMNGHDSEVDSSSRVHRTKLRRNDTKQWDIATVAHLEGLRNATVRVLDNERQREKCFKRLRSFEKAYFRRPIQKLKVRKSSKGSQVNSTIPDVSNCL